MMSERNTAPLDKLYIKNLVRSLDKAFAGTNRYQAHSTAADLLRNEGNSNKLLHACLSHILTEKDLFSRTRNGPVVAFNLVNSWKYFIQVHCWCPLPTRQNNISHNWIHHHEDRLLTSLNMFGSGYESLLFKQLRDDDISDNDSVKLRVDKEFTHGKNNIEYVPAHTPHLVFIPDDLTITFTIWSCDSDNLKESIRRSKHLNFVKKSVKKLANKLQLTNQIEKRIDNQSRQFAPVNGQMKCVGKVNYPDSDNMNYMQNLFYILQKTEYINHGTINSLRSKATAENRSDVVSLIDNFLAGEMISDKYESAHLNVPNINFTRDAVMKSCVA